MGALDHIRVVEYGANITAPFCSRLFADLGAEVIKLEPPGGDPARHRAPFAQCDDGQPMSGFFYYLNAAKSSLVVDLDLVNDRELVWRMLAGADLFIENLPNEKRLAWQLDHESLARQFPHLIVVSLSAFGRTGPWKDKQGTDITIQAASSLSVVLGRQGSQPLRIPFDQAEYQAGLHAMAAALCALFERERSGLGQGIDISAAQVMGHQVGGMHLVSKKRGGQWNRAAMFPGSSTFPSGFFACADGYLSVTSTQPKYWQTYLKLMGEPEWAQDEKQRDEIFLARTDTIEPAHRHFKEWLLKHTRAELTQMAAEHDILLCVVNKPKDLYESDQFAFRQVWSEVTLGEQHARFPKPGYLLSETPTCVRDLAPLLNADAERILANPWQPRQLKSGNSTRGQGALAGVRILDFGWNWAGPMAGQLLADMGAEVIRIEANDRLDKMRQDSYGYFFCHNNRNKMSATFNIKHPQGVRLLKQLVARCDVVMDNFASGVMAKNGLSYDDLRAANPDIIVMSMSMAGEYGPARGMRGYASIATAYTGLEGLVGYPDTNQVTGFLSFGLGDTNMSIQGVVGILAALVYRQRTGQGQYVDISQIECSAATLGEMIMQYALQGISPGIQGNSHVEYAPHNFYATRGIEQWVAISVTNEQQWQGLCRAMERPDLLKRSNLSNAQGRLEGVAELNALVSDWCQHQERQAVLDALDSQGVPCAALFSAQERDQHPQFVERDCIYQHHSPHFENCDIYHTPWRLTATPPRICRTAPAVGEQNDYVFHDIMGMTVVAVEKLKAAGVLH